MAVLKNGITFKSKIMRFKLILCLVVCLYSCGTNNAKLTTICSPKRQNTICHDYTEKQVKEIAGSDLYYFRQRTLNKMLFYGRKYNLSDTTLIRLAYAESRFNPLAHSKCGAKGVFQISPLMEKHYRKKGITSRIEMGVRFLAKLYAESKDMRSALSYYNSGYWHSKDKKVLKFINYITND